MTVYENAEQRFEDQIWVCLCCGPSALLSHGSREVDLKATALMKLIYLEMFGHDMSWASFYVLEVMSSAKYLQKRVGYLGAIQSFRPDTEVLMLATNLFKKVPERFLMRKEIGVDLLSGYRIADTAHDRFTPCRLTSCHQLLLDTLPLNRPHPKVISF